nr:ejaculatory bulb-specific protein 3-like [Onthophagus taurus]
MKQFIFIAFCLTAVVAVAVEKYTTRYDGVNLDDILKNKRLLKGYTNCLLDKGPCSPDGTELKTDLPDALQNDCAKCTDVQKAGAKKIINFLIDNESKIWNDLEAKYDPQGVYVKQYRNKAHAEGIKI